jgi:hypothetical protein
LHVIGWGKTGGVPMDERLEGNGEVGSRIR